MAAAFQRHPRIWVLAALLCLGCPFVSPPGGGGQDTNTHLNVDTPDTLVMVAGDSLTVEVDTTTNNTRGRRLPSSASYEIRLAPRYEAPGAEPIPAGSFDYSFDYGVASAQRPRLAELTIDTRGDVAPGVYEHEIELTSSVSGVFEVDAPARMRVVVLPTGGAVKTRRVRTLSAGQGHSLALLDDGTVWAWGGNLSDQMAGLTAANHQLSPLRVPGLTGMSGLAAGAFHTLTRHNRCGNLWAWGRNVSGQLGRSDVSLSSARPLPVYGLAEGDIEPGCPLGLRVWQRGRGTISDASGAFGDGGCRQDCDAAFDEGSAVNLSAEPDPGHEFVEWRGDCSGRAPTLSVTLDESKNCIAVYRPIPGFDAPPEASFRILATEVVADQIVGFDAGESGDDGEIVLYEWDFEDDGRFDDTGRLTSHGFASTGRHVIRLRVSDNAGQSAETTRELVVAELSDPDPDPAGGPTLTVEFAGGGLGRVRSDDGTLDCTDTCSEPFTPGSRIFLMPMPDSGSLFSHWGFDGLPETGGDCDEDFGVEGCRLDFDGDRTVRLYFERP